MTSMVGGSLGGLLGGQAKGGHRGDVGFWNPTRGSEWWVLDQVPVFVQLFPLSPQGCFGEVPVIIRRKICFWMGCYGTEFFREVG